MQGSHLFLLGLCDERRWRVLWTTGSTPRHEVYNVCCVEDDMYICHVCLTSIRRSGLQSILQSQKSVLRRLKERQLQNLGSARSRTRHPGPVRRSRSSSRAVDLFVSEFHHRPPERLRNDPSASTVHPAFQLIAEGDWSLA